MVFIKRNKGSWRDKKPQVSHDKTRYTYGKPEHIGKDSSCPEGEMEMFVESVD